MLTNSGDLALTSIAITASAGFQQSSTCGTQLAGHASCSISVVFAPTTMGSISGNLSVSDAIRTQTSRSRASGCSRRHQREPGATEFSAQPVARSVRRST